MCTFFRMYCILTTSSLITLFTQSIFLAEIHHDMNRRMESSKRWLETKKSKSPVKKEKSPAKTKSSPAKKSPSTTPKPAASARKQSHSAIILSLTDPTYKEMMHKYFRKMGPKSNKSQLSDADEAVEMLKEFKSMSSGKFMKIENWRDPSSDHVEVDDDEAVKRIKIDLTRRNDSIKQWLDPKPKSSASKSEKPPPKKSLPERDTVEEEDSDDESDSPEPTTRTLRKKEIPNYANSGAEIVSKTALQVEAERTAKQSLSAKDKISSENKKSPSKDVSKSKHLGTYVFDSNDRVFYDLSSRVTKFKENDTILSLRDAKYRDVLVSCFHRLGTEQDKDKNHEAADEVFQIFKQEGGRFFKPTGRGKDADCDQVEESQALQNMYLDIRRRTESTWWLDEKEDVSSSKKKSSSGMTKAKKKAKPTRHIIVSLSDPNYRAIMEVEFKKLGEKTGADKREVAAAEEVFERFKREGAVFCRLENFRDVTSDPIEMDEVEAFKKIRTDMQRRMESAKRWLDGGVNSKSYAVSNTSSPKQPPPAHKTSKKSNPGNSKKRELPVQPHRSSPTKKKVKVDASRPRSEVPSHSEDTRKSSRVVAESSKRRSERLASSMDTVAANLSRSRSAPRNRSQQRPGNADNVTICFGDHAIDTESNPSSIQFSQNILEALPGRFDPNVRPPVPAYNKQIYIPGSEVYARWLNEHDPSSYGTWYPGYVYSSKLAPTNVPGGDMPKLLYHVRFHDGAEGMDLHTNDMMMREQYEAWLRDLEEYYALPQLGSAFTTHIPKGARVYAQWIDPTDPGAHGSWLQGTVRDVKDSSRYHVRFDNGDEDDDMSAKHVLLDGVYVQLLGEKMKNDSGPVVNRGLGVVNGINDTNGHQHPRLVDNNSRATVASATQRVQKPSTLKFTCEIATEDLDLSSNDAILEELHCDEVLATIKPFERCKTQGIHYGIYVKPKPWNNTPQLEVTVPMEIDKPSGNEVKSKDVSVEDLRCEETLV